MKGGLIYLYLFILSYCQRDSSLVYFQVHHPQGKNLMDYESQKFMMHCRTPCIPKDYGSSTIGGIGIDLQRLNRALQINALRNRLNQTTKNSSRS